jgi:hypothetical protein
MPVLSRRSRLEVPTAADETAAGPIIVLPDAGDDLVEDPHHGAADADGRARDERAFEAAFTRWACDPVKGDVVAVPGLGPLPLGVVLVRLLTSPTQLSGRAAAGLGLGHHATVGELAAALHDAREHPRGPRCRSYRSALYYLRGLEQLDDDAPEPLLST